MDLDHIGESNEEQTMAADTSIIDGLHVELQLEMVCGLDSCLGAEFK